ncbi:hypothetical protein [Chroococcidiopsis thermalis]|nr:hypothetical protein [Chroococcidiopsis thermalis]
MNFSVNLRTSVIREQGAGTSWEQGGRGTEKQQPITNYQLPLTSFQ